VIDEDTSSIKVVRHLEGEKRFPTELSAFNVRKNVTLISDVLIIKKTPVTRIANLRLDNMSTVRLTQLLYDWEY
jgi:hypothetical protein